MIFKRIYLYIKVNNPSKMEQLRIVERNKTNLEIKSIKTSITRSKATIDRFRSQEKSSFNDAQIVKLSTKILADEEKLKSLDEIIIKLGSNEYDSYLNEQKESTDIVNRKQAELGARKVKEKYQKKVDEKEKIDNYYQSQRGTGGVSENSLKKETEKFYKNFLTVPDNMNGNLNKMPNNKGFIWRGVWCFGKLPMKNKGQIIFSEKKGHLYHEIEITDTHKTTYEKVGKNNRKFLFKEERKVLH